MRTVVPILVPASFIEDGESQPAVGAHATYRPILIEVSEVDDPDTDLHRRGTPWYPRPTPLLRADPRPGARMEG